MLMLIGYKDRMISHRWSIFLGGYMKCQVYRNNPQSMPELKDKIIRVIVEIENSKSQQ